MQPILLANGQRGVVQSPQILTAGTTLVVDFPSLTSAPSVVQVTPAGTNTSHQPQGAPPGTASVAPLQTAQALLPPGTVVEGTLTAQNDAGQVELTLNRPPQLAGQTVTLNLTDSAGKPAASSTLAMGTTLTVQVGTNAAMATVISATLPQATQKANAVALLGQQWPALTRATALLNQQAPAMAQNLAQHLPHVENLLPGLAHVMQAIRTGNLGDMTGPELANTLRTAAPDLETNLVTLSPLQHRGEATPDAPIPWRGTLFPYVEGPLDKDPKQGRFFWRREQQDDPRGKAATRFVMELSLSATGPLQLDGLVQYPEMWLKLRRTTPAEDGFTQGLQSVVAGLMEAYGLTGGISVEVTPRFPLNPVQEILAANPVATGRAGS
jgi:hypothetical protein